MHAIKEVVIHARETISGVGVNPNFFRGGRKFSAKIRYQRPKICPFLTTPKKPNFICTFPTIL